MAYEFFDWEYGTGVGFTGGYDPESTFTLSFWNGKGETFRGMSRGEDFTIDLGDCAWQWKETGRTEITEDEMNEDMEDIMGAVLEVLDLTEEEEASIRRDLRSFLSKHYLNWDLTQLYEEDEED